jgi:hypothetical protein
MEQHNFLKHPFIEDKSILQLCDNPFLCERCELTIRKLNKLRFSDFISSIDMDSKVYLMSSRILPTDFFINFQNFTSIENLFHLIIDRGSDEIREYIKKTKILLLSYIENSHYYTYPVLNLEIYFFGDLPSDCIKFLTDLGLYTFPLHTGDVGMFELEEKSIERIEMDISCLLDSELIQDTSGLFLSNTHNIYGTESLRSQLQYLTIFNIHDVEFDENNDVIIPNFKEYQSYNPKEKTIEKDLEF